MIIQKGDPCILKIQYFVSGVRLVFQSLLQLNNLNIICKK